MSTTEEAEKEPAGAPEPPAPESKEGADDDAEAAPRRAALDPDGMERPKFLLDYPEDPALERLITAFEKGNYALIRREAEALASSTKEPAVRDAALELRRRIDPDPLAKYLLVIAAVLLLFLVIWSYRQGGP